jgi:hypothetical protein
LDDIVIFSITFAEHFQHVTFVLGILSKAKLVLTVSKCEIDMKQIIFLGHMVSATSITPATDAIQAILNVQEPQTRKQANQFLGGLVYYQKFVPHFAHLAAPIHKMNNLTKNKRHLF